MYLEAAEVRLTYDDLVVLLPFNVDIYKFSYEDMIFPNGEFFIIDIYLFWFYCLGTC